MTKTLKEILDLPEGSEERKRELYKMQTEELKQAREGFTCVRCSALVKDDCTLCTECALDDADHLADEVEEQ